MMRPLESMVEVLFHPRRYYARPHRFEEGLLWIGVAVGLATVAGRALRVNSAADVLFVATAVAAVVVIFPTLLYVMARCVGGRGDFETSFSAMALGLLGTLIPALAIIAIAPATESDFPWTPAQSTCMVLGAWFLYVVWNCLTMLHGLPWWKSLTVLALVAIASIPYYGAVIWLLIGIVLTFGLVVSWRDAS